MFRQGSTCLVLLWILLALIRFRLRDFHPLWSDFPIPFFYPLRYTLQSKPHIARNMVWALSISLAATLEIDVSFSSSGYLDVSVHRVPFLTLWIGVRMTEVCSAGFPHSDISGSLDICSSPKLFAAYHVFHRLLVPRHPPYALSCITNMLRLTGMSLRDTYIALYALVISGLLFYFVFSKLLIKVLVTLKNNNHLGCLV